VLENGKRHEELALEEGPQTAQAGGPRPRNVANRPARPPAPNAQDLSERVKRLAENRFQVQRSDVEEVARNPAQLFSQARILPKYENGQMTGVQLNAIRPGSLFEQIGIQNGDTIVEFNGLKIDSPEQSAELLREFQESKQFNVTVQRSNGEQVPLTYELSE
jgi:general secretion pathway protein C